MTPLIAILLQNALIATIAILLCLGITRVFVVPARLERLLWIAIAVRFIWPSPVSLPLPDLRAVQPARELAYTLATVGASSPAPITGATLPAAPLSAAPLSDDPLSDDPIAPSSLTLGTVLIVVWLLGAVATLGTRIRRMLRWSRRRRALPPPEPLARMVREVAADMRVTAPQVVVDPHLTVPAVAGLVRTRCSQAASGPVPRSAGS